MVPMEPGKAGISRGSGPCKCHSETQAWSLVWANGATGHFDTVMPVVCWRWIPEVVARDRVDRNTIGHSEELTVQKLGAKNWGSCWRGRCLFGGLFCVFLLFLWFCSSSPEDVFPITFQGEWKERGGEGADTPQPGLGNKYASSARASVLTIEPPQPGLFCGF